VTGNVDNNKVKIQELPQFFEAALVLFNYAHFLTHKLKLL